MQFLRENQGEAAKAITKRIRQELEAGKRVLWLVSGGSNVAPAVTIMAGLQETCAAKLDQLAVLPMDERYGKRGHADSNTQQLRAAGFDPSSATWIDVLEHDVPFDQTISFYNDVAATALASAHIVVGQFGIGDNTHIAGIQPDSPAAMADETTVAGYEWDDYERLTLTPVALKHITVAYVLAYGANKKIALQRLQKHAEPLSKLPAVLLYELPEVYVYNDLLGTSA
jgi:6-phosphogluconolactonase/glucosamine-6-phosphate isomerase/deaminase